MWSSRAILASISVLFAVAAGFASHAQACANDGLVGPCHCAQRAAMFGVAVPASVTKLTGATSTGATSTGASGDYLPMSFNSSPALAPVSTTNVHVFNFDFSTNPAGGMIMDAVIHVGDTIHWQWDSGTHSVTSVAGSIDNFDSTNKSSPSGTFDHTFNTVGTITYYCDIHGADNGDGTASGMSGTITVLPVPEPTTVAIAGAASILPLSRRRR